MGKAMNNKSWLYIRGAFYRGMENLFGSCLQTYNQSSSSFSSICHIQRERYSLQIAGGSMLMGWIQRWRLKFIPYSVTKSVYIYLVQKRNSVILKRWNIGPGTTSTISGNEKAMPEWEIYLFIIRLIEYWELSCL